MKGTLFSADFIKDSSDNLRLLEFNTDTGFISQSLQYFDFSGLVSLLNDNSITKFHVVYKLIAKDFVELLSGSLSSAMPELQSFETTIEDGHTIYPTTITDAEDTFILRLAYDESAIFDSTYCANTVELYKLFADNNNSSSIAEFSYKSDDYNFNNLPAIFNSSNLPDFVAKPYSSAHGNPLEFHKVGTDSTLGATSEEKLQNYLNEVSQDLTLVQRFYNNPADQKSKAIRAYSIIYGSSLDILTVASFETEALLDKPTSITFDSLLIKNIVDKKHYFELTTNFLKANDGGVLEGEEVIKSDGTAVLIENATIGDLFKSFNIPGSPDSDDINLVHAWRYTGSTLPSGSQVVDTTLVNKQVVDLKYDFVNHLKLSDGTEFNLGPNLLILVYNISKDELKYEAAMWVDPSKYKMLGDENQLVDIISNDTLILDGEYKTYVLDMEETDTFFLKGGNVGIKLITHNCFVEGTLINDAEGNPIKIEDLKPGDKVQSAKILEDGSLKVEAKEITDITSSKKGPIFKIHVGDKLIEGTASHPMFVNGKWVKIKDLKVGDKLTNSKGEEVEITEIEVLDEIKVVYNLHGVVDNRNFFVEDYLSHNKAPPPLLSCFIAGTEVTLHDGDTKNIEDVVEGDVVLSFNEETKEQEPKEVVGVKSPIHDDLVKYTLSNGIEITSTYDHPYYVNGLTLASYKPEWTNERYDLPSAVSKIKVGDFVYPLDGDVNVEIVSIEELPRVETQTYIFSVDGNRNFYANGILVHNK
jgi:intein/homing endonuclease